MKKTKSQIKWEPDTSSAGLAKRAEFAKAAMQGLASTFKPDPVHGLVLFRPANVAVSAVELADALLQELAKPQA